MPARGSLRQRERERIFVKKNNNNNNNNSKSVRNDFTVKQMIKNDKKKNQDKRYIITFLIRNDV